VARKRGEVLKNTRPNQDCGNPVKSPRSLGKRPKELEKTEREGAPFLPQGAKQSKRRQCTRGGVQGTEARRRPYETPLKRRPQRKRAKKPLGKDNVHSVPKVKNKKKKKQNKKTHKQVREPIFEPKVVT